MIGQTFSSKQTMKRQPLFSREDQKDFWTAFLLFGLWVLIPIQPWFSPIELFGLSLLALSSYVQRSRYFLLVILGSSVYLSHPLRDFWIPLVCLNFPILMQWMRGFWGKVSLRHSLGITLLQSFMGFFLCLLLYMTTLGLLDNPELFETFHLSLPSIIIWLLFVCIGAFFCPPWLFSTHKWGLYALSWILLCFISGSLFLGFYLLWDTSFLIPFVLWSVGKAWCLAGLSIFINRLVQPKMCLSSSSH